jgi:hypothetical protein
MITPAKAIDLAAQAYQAEPDLIGPRSDHPIRIHFREVDGILYIVPEGTKTRLDWADNVLAWAVPDLATIAHGITFIPEGFYYSSASVVDELVSTIGPRQFGIVGHSRGGAQAGVLAYLLASRGVIAQKIYVIEPARAFIFRIPRVFEQIEVWGCWNGNDPVPHVPFGEQFKLDIIGQPTRDPFDCHHISAVADAWAVAQKTSVAA